MSTTKQQHSRRFQFSLKVGFLGVTLSAIVIAVVVAYISRREHYTSQRRLFKCVVFDDVAGVRRILDDSPGLTFSRDFYAGTPLHLAVSNSRHISPEMVRILLKHFDPNTTGAEGEKGVLVTLAANSFDAADSKRLNRDRVLAAKMLVESGVDLNAVDLHGWTALHWSVAVGNIQLVELLLEKGARTDVRDSRYGFTPLHLACISLNPDIAARLLEHKADPQLRDKMGRTPEELVRLDLQHTKWPRSNGRDLPPGETKIVTYRTNEKDPQKIAEMENEMIRVFDEH